MVRQLRGGEVMLVHSKKCACPKGPDDLRPIALSSALQKLFKVSLKHLPEMWSFIADVRGLVFGKQANDVRHPLQAGVAKTREFGVELLVG